MDTQTATPATMFLSISLYVATTKLPSYLTISKLTGPVHCSTTVQKHYTGVTIDSLGRVAVLVDRLLAAGLGEIHPRGDGWLYQGRVPARLV